MLSALSGPLLTTNSNPIFKDVMSRLPNVLLWNWLNVLLFDIANQRLSQSIVEDSVNKPWRPVPSGRITPVGARRLLLAVVPLVFLASCLLGGMPETVAMIVLGYMYNDLGGSNENYNIRNLINALGFMCYSSGALTVAAGFGQHELSDDAMPWISIVGMVVFSTLSMQDMPDIPGDAAIGRRTLPLIHGETFARWAIAIPVLFWSFACPAFWQLKAKAYLPSIGVGGLLAFRVLVFRSVESDKNSWRLWCLWTMVIYALPLIGNSSAVVDLAENVFALVLSLGYGLSSSLFSFLPL
jgi:4-hydroxybenzoate polyprenyltransferase